MSLRESTLIYPVVSIVEIDGQRMLETKLDASTITYKPLEETKAVVIRRGRRAKQPTDELESGDGGGGVHSS